MKVIFRENLNEMIRIWLVAKLVVRNRENDWHFRSESVNGMHELQTKRMRLPFCPK